MNGRPGVRERTRRLVLSAAEELGAGELRVPARTLDVGLVGVIVPELANPIYPAIAQLLEARLAAAGYTAVLGCVTGGVDEIEYLATLAERGVAGLIMVSGRHADGDGDQTLYHELLRRSTPMVFVNGYHPELPAPFVSCDDRLASELAVRHLASLGHRRIAFVGGPSRYVVVQRKLDGFRQALTESGLTIDERLVLNTLFSVEGGRASVPTLADHGATAVVAASDLLALGTILGARGRDLDVPTEWSAVGFDDSALMAYTDPPLTTVRQPIEAMCEHAVRLLLEQIDGAGSANHEFLFRPELVVRRSTGLLSRRLSRR